MPLVEVTCTIKINGAPIQSAPFTYSFFAPEYSEISFLKSGTDGVNYFSFGQLGTQNGFGIQTDTDILLGFLGQSTGLALNAGGLMILLGGTLSAGAPQNLMVNNNSGKQAHISGFEFGP